MIIEYKKVINLSSLHVCTQTLFSPFCVADCLFSSVFSGSEKFAEIFLGEFDTPEAIWSNEMRYTYDYSYSSIRDSVVIVCWQNGSRSRLPLAHEKVKLYSGCLFRWLNVPPDTNFVGQTSLRMPTSLIKHSSFDHYMKS